MSSDDREIGDTGDAGGSNGGTRLKGPGAGEADGPAAGGPGGAARPGGASGPEGVAPGTGGVALLCDAGGRVTRLVRHALPGWSVAAGLHLGDLVDPAGRSKARAFLEELKLKGAAFGWPIPAPVAGAVRLLHFTGARSGGAGEGAELLIAAAASPPGAERLYDEVARINNEQANLARTRAQDVAAASTSDIGGGVSGGGGGGGGGHEQLEAFSRLNNELATAQRELARRNAELGRANHALADARAALEQKQADLIAANARLEALATEDGLTGLKNRRALEATLRAEVDRALRYGSPLSLAMIDVDEFKSYNDAFGHPAGDDVLRRVAALLRGKTRSSDVVARYGGEEMAVVLVQTPAPGAAAAAELLRRAVERADWPRRAVTISIGVASLGPGATTAETLIARADAALYASKRGGRNRVTVAGDTDTGTGGGTGGGSRGGDGGGGGGGSRGGDGGARGGGDGGGE